MDDEDVDEKLIESNGAADANHDEAEDPDQSCNDDASGMLNIFHNTSPASFCKNVITYWWM